MKYIFKLDIIEFSSYARVKKMKNENLSKEKKKRDQERAIYLLIKYERKIVFFRWIKLLKECRVINEDYYEKNERL